LKKRRKRNRDKESREERDRQRAEKAEDEERWANARRNKPILMSEGFSGDDLHSFIPSSLDAANASPPWQNRQGSSFATLASPSTSPDAPRTVWGTALIAPPSPELHTQQSDRDDGWLQWDLESDNQLIEQVQAASLNGEASATVKTTGQGKKKKAKKITLMSTTARRAA